MTKTPFLTLACSVAIGSLASTAQAVSSAELYTEASYPYGRFEARVQFAGGDGVVGSFFLWKPGSEESGVFWNELDLETIWAECELKTNALYGDPEASHTQSSGTAGNWCSSFHTYAYEWTPDYIAWFVDGMEVRRETGADSVAFRDNAPDGMQIHFNVWPGDSTFGGNFSPSILPVFEYINWVQYSSYSNGQFQLEWREDFSGDSLPEGWLTGDWGSPKGLSTHAPANVAFIDGYAVISMTADDATGSAGAAPMDPEGGGPVEEPAPEVPADGEPMSGAGGAAPSNPEPNPPAEPGGPVEGEPAAGAGGAGNPPDDPGAGPMMSAPPADGTTAPPGESTAGNAEGTSSPPPAAGATLPAPGEGQPAPDQTATPGAGSATPAAGAGTMPAVAASNPGTVSPGPAPATAPTVQTEASDGEGGCGMAGAPASSGWAWVALLLGLFTSRVRRRTRS